MNERRFTHPWTPWMAIVATASVAAGCSCSGSSGGASAPDAGAPTDAAANEGSASDASVDVSIDASADAAADAAADALGDGSAGMNVAPQRVTIPGKVAGCEIQRLSNAQQLRVFQWEPCPGIAGCERTVTNPSVLSDIPNSGYAAVGIDDENGLTRFGLDALDPSQSTEGTYYTTADGQALDGFRAIGADVCQPITSIRGSRRGIIVTVFPTGKPPVFGGILDSFDSTSPPALFDVPAGQNGGPSGGSIPLGDSRWMWAWVLPERLTSVSAVDGTDFREVAKVQPYGPLAYVEYPVTTGPLFLFHEYLVDADAGTATAIIASSDGIAAPTPYLVPTDDSFFIDPGCAGTHVAWVRGLHPTDVDTFASVEMWASPYSPNPADLKPYKVDDVPFGFASGSFVAAHGKYAAIYSTIQSPFTAQIFIWDLASKSRQIINMSPNLAVKTAYGLTQSYVYVGSAPPNTSANKWIMRLKLP